MSNTFVTMVGGGGGGGASGGGTTITTNTTGTAYIPPTTTVLPVNGIGSAGSYYTTGTGSSPMWTSTTPNTSTISMPGKNPVIKTDKNEINLDEAAELMKIIKERLLVIIPDFEKHEKYAALKKAYDHYKLIEAMVQEEKK